jgi:hypothetical protein
MTLPLGAAGERTLQASIRGSYGKATSKAPPTQPEMDYIYIMYKII